MLLPHALPVPADDRQLGGQVQINIVSYIPRPTANAE
jgi:hypothetical protein